MRDEFLSDLNEMIRGELIKFVAAHSDDDYYFSSDRTEAIVDEDLKSQQK
jgi:hypothetical protein